VTPDGHTSPQGTHARTHANTHAAMAGKHTLSMRPRASKGCEAPHPARIGHHEPRPRPWHRTSGKYIRGGGGGVVGDSCRPRSVGNHHQRAHLHANGALGKPVRPVAAVANQQGDGAAQLWGQVPLLEHVNEVAQHAGPAPGSHAHARKRGWVVRMQHPQNPDARCARALSPRQPATHNTQLRESVHANAVGAHAPHFRVADGAQVAGVGGVCHDEA
jgi:hypothetical protein